MRISLLCLSLPMLVISMIVGGCGKKDQEPRVGTSSQAAIAVHLLVPAAQGGPSVIVLGGRLKADEEITLTARVAGRVTALPAAAGSRVRTGAPLAVFAAPEAGAAAQAARSTAASARVRRDVAARQAARVDTLFNAHAVTQRERDTAHDALQAAVAAWRAAEAVREEAVQSLLLRAPFEGVVVRHVVDRGASVQPGQPLLLFRSAGAGEVVVSVPESAAARAAAAQWSLQGPDGEWRPARLLRLEGAVDPATRSRVAYLAAEPLRDAQPGAFVRVRLATDRTPGATGAPRVPAAAVITRGELTGVFVLRDGHAWLRWVRLGAGDGGEREILSGLGPADSIAADARGLVDGAPVRILQ